MATADSPLHDLDGVRGMNVLLHELEHLYEYPSSLHTLTYQLYHSFCGRSKYPQGSRVTQHSEHDRQTSHFTSTWSSVLDAECTDISQQSIS